MVNPIVALPMTGIDLASSRRQKGLIGLNNYIQVSSIFN